MQERRNDTPRSRRMTPLKSLPTEYRTPRSKRTAFGFAGSLVSSSTVRELVQGRYPRHPFVIVDCRFPYEYNGGHIPSALNFPPDQLTSLMHHVNQFASQCTGPPGLVILHCEFSQCRAPRMAYELNRQIPSQQIELYVMKGGYADFWRRFPDVCQPKGYTTM